MLERIAFVSGAAPHPSGPPSLARAVADMLAEEQTGVICFTVSVTPASIREAIPSPAHYVLERDQPDAYEAAADFLNLNRVDVVSLRHAGAAFGGPAGNYVLAFLRLLKMPVVTTLAGLPLEPDQDRVLNEVVRQSARLVVASRAAREEVHLRYGLPPERIDVIAAAASPWVEGQAAREAARPYLNSMRRAHSVPRLAPASARPEAALAEYPGPLPLVNLGHVRQLTDDTGLLRRAALTVPEYAGGYASEDNACALAAMVLLESLGEDWFTDAQTLAPRYLAFLMYAFRPETGEFRPALSYSRQWEALPGSEEVHGRVLWALGLTLGYSHRPGLRGAASQLFQSALPAALSFSRPLAQAWAVLGLQAYLRRLPGDRAAAGALEHLGSRLMALSSSGRAVSARIGGACLPHALLAGGQWLDRPDMVEAGLDLLLDLAAGQCMPDGYFDPLPSDVAELPLTAGLQPSRTHAMVSACLAAYQLTGQRSWYGEARRAFHWFLGHNESQLPLYDPITGGCRDGLSPHAVQPHQGALATLSFLLALLEMRLAEPGPRLALKPPAPWLAIVPVDSPSI